MKSTVLQRPLTYWLTATALFPNSNFILPLSIAIRDKFFGGSISFLNKETVQDFEIHTLLSVYSLRRQSFKIILLCSEIALALINLITHRLILSNQDALRMQIILLILQTRSRACNYIFVNYI